MEMRMTTMLKAGAATAAAVLASLAVPAWAQAPGPQPAAAADSLFRATTLNLSAYGEARVQPDMATIALGVTTEGPTAAQAMSANAARMSQVLAALKAGGVAARDIQTSNLNLQPKYVYAQNEAPRLTGYQATNDVTVAVRDLSRLGAAVDASVTAGANQVNGISFGLADPTPAENSARLEAVKALGAKADLYAKATGHRLLRLVSLSEGGGYSPGPPMPLQAFAKSAQIAAAPRVEPGELKVRVEVSGLYELTR